MVDPKYVHIKITDIPKEFILEYNLAGTRLNPFVTHPPF
jgi:hypothetical protein